MTKQKKYLSDGHVLFVNCGYDLKKRWYAQYWVKNSLKPFRVWISYELDTIEKRVSEFDRIKKELIEKGHCDKPKKHKQVKHEKITAALFNALNVKKPYLKPKSYQTYLSNLLIFDTYCESKKVKLITKKTLLDFTEYLITDNSNRVGTTVNNILRTLTTLGNGIVRSSYIDKEAFKRVKKVAQYNSARGYFLASDKEKIKQYLLKNNPALWVVCQFLYWSCLRPCNELRFLQIKDIDFNLGIIRIGGNIAKNKRTQTVKITPALLAILRGLQLEKYDINYYLFGLKCVPNQKPVSRDYFSKHFSKCLLDMNFDKRGQKISIYSFKTTWTIDAYEKGYGIKEIMTHLRHKNIETTDFYLRSLGLYTTENFNKMLDL